MPQNQTTPLVDCNSWQRFFVLLLFPEIPAGCIHIESIYIMRLKRINSIDSWLITCLLDSLSYPFISFLTNEFIKHERKGIFHKMHCKTEQFA